MSVFSTVGEERNDERDVTHLDGGVHHALHFVREAVFLRG